MCNTITKLYASLPFLSREQQEQALITAQRFSKPAGNLFQTRIDA